MMLITKVLKRTTGEDNKKTEMYEYSLIVLWGPFVLIPIQVHDGQSFSTHRSYSIGCHFGKHLNTIRSTATIFLS